MSNVWNYGITACYVSNGHDAAWTGYPIKDNGVTYLLVKLDPCGLELFNDVTGAEWVLELGL